MSLGLKTKIKQPGGSSSKAAPKQRTGGAGSGRTGDTLDSGSDSEEADEMESGSDGEARPKRQRGLNHQPRGGRGLPTMWGEGGLLGVGAFNDVGQRMGRWGRAVASCDTTCLPGQTHCTALHLIVDPKTLRPVRLTGLVRCT